MNNQVYILGGVQTDFQRNWSKEGKGIIAMAREIINDTLNSLEIDYKEIANLGKERRVGVFVGNFDAQQFVNQGHLGALLTEIHPAFNGIFGLRYEAACASGAAAIDAAATKIKAQECDLAIVLGIEIMKSVPSIIGGNFLGTAALYDVEAKNKSFPFPNLFANLVDVIIERYKIPEKILLNALAEISSINYSNAKNNPNAQTRAWFMNKDHASKRKQIFNSVVGGKLCITDCSQITDGASSIVLASTKYADRYMKRKKLKYNLPRIKGQGYTVAPFSFVDKINYSKGNKYILPFTRQAVCDAYNSAHLTINNIDIFETHDCFTSSEYITLSSMGLCEPGDEFKIIANGTIGFHGSKPVNPGGGLIGIGHPVGATGVRMMLDLFKQITNTAENYQVAGAKNGLMLNIGGTATTNITFIIGT